MSINTVSITGRLTAQPEAQYFESGAIKAQFAIAISDYNNGEEQTSFIPIETWGQSAEYAVNYVHKGDLVGVSGNLKQDRWNDRNSGEHRSRIYVRAMRLELLRKVNGDATKPNTANSESPAPETAPPEL